MASDDMIRELCTITTSDEAGRHFTQTANYWRELEVEGLIEVHRPVHDGTGIPYAAEFWTVHITPEGQALASTSEHLHPA